VVLLTTEDRPPRGKDSAIAGGTRRQGAVPQCLIKTFRGPEVLSREKVLVSLRYGQRQLGRLFLVGYLTTLRSSQTALRDDGASLIGRLIALPLASKGSR
jgi:hypothetical protein